MWMSVDPKAHWYPSNSPYVYALNNPVNLTDPNGMWVEGAGVFNNLFKSDEKILAQRDADLHNGEAFKVDDGVWRATWTTKNNNSDGDVNLDDIHISEYDRGIKKDG